MSLPLTREDIAEAVRRAVAWRIAVAQAGGYPGNVDEAIQGDPAPVAAVRASEDADGWLTAGVVWDTVTGWTAGGNCGLAVRWHPASGRVRVERPVEREVALPPPHWSSPYLSGEGHNQALPDHYHERDGVPTCGACTVAATREKTTIGWIGRPLAIGERYVCGVCGAIVGAG